VHFTTESGLPSNRVFDILETASGIVWARTQAGLAWYNGYCWDKIGMAKGLPEQMIYNFASGSNDSILILCNEKLFYGNQHGFRFIPFVIKGVEHKINGIASVHRNEFICLCDSVLYLIKEGEFSPITFSRNLGNEKVISLWSTQNAPWITTHSGLYRLENGEWVIKLKALHSLVSVRMLIENVNGDGLAFINGPREYFGLWEWNAGGVPAYNSKEGTAYVLASDIKPNREAFLVKESDICKIYNGKNWNTLIPSPEQFQNVLFIKYRSNGDLWVGTEGGLSLHRELFEKWKDVRFSSPDLRNNINEIIIRKDGSVWMASGGGLLIYDPDCAVKTINKIQGKELGIITGVAEDDEGNLWISSGLTFEGAYVLKGSQWRHFGVSDGLDAGYIHKIKKDKHGNLWFLGLSRSDYESRKVEEEPGAYIYSNGRFKQWGTKQGLINGRVFDLKEGIDGALWFGTNGGLCRWMPENTSSSQGKWTHWTAKEGLRMNRVFTIAIDSQNTVWFGDQNNGLGFIENDKPKYLTTQDGLISDAVWSIAIDMSDKLWIGTRGGVSIYDRITWSSIDNNEGLEYTSVWPILPTKGNVYIGTFGGGLDILNTLLVNDKYPMIVSEKPIIHSNVLYTNCKIFSYWGVQQSKDIDIRYRVDQGKWSGWTRQREITVGDLSSGDHVLQIQAKNLVGEYNPHGKNISFYVEPPYYFQPIFYLPIGFLSLGLIALGSIYLLRKKRQDIALRKSEIRYRNLFETANDAIMILEPKNGIILEVNKKACEMYGIIKDEFVGKSVRDISMNINQGNEIVEQTLHSRRISSFETVHRTKANDEISVTVNASVIDYDGREAIMSLNRNITDQKQSEAKIRLLAQTVASAKDAICITDLDNYFLFVNDAFIQMYEFSEEELIGKHVSIIASPPTPIEVQKQIHQATLAGGWNGETINRRKDGKEFPIELWSSVVYDINNNPVALVGVARDITERKRAEKTREKLITELREALTEVKALSGLLPICSNCKKIRDDKGYWTQVETYIAKHTDATFTHGICPDCTKELFPDVYKRLKDKDTSY
jgi:PAS domain S-box-containing protein